MTIFFHIADGFLWMTSRKWDQLLSQRSSTALRSLVHITKLPSRESLLWYSRTCACQCPQSPADMVCRPRRVHKFKMLKTWPDIRNLDPADHVCPWTTEYFSLGFNFPKWGMQGADRVIFQASSTLIFLDIWGKYKIFSGNRWLRTCTSFHVISLVVCKKQLGNYVLEVALSFILILSLLLTIGETLHDYFSFLDSGVLIFGVQITM